MIAIGIGCRRSCAGEAIAALVSRTRKTMIADSAILFTIEDKREEIGMIEAARALNLPLVFLTRAALAAVSPRLLTRSALVEARFGTGSVAEAAALAGAGPRARLIAPRASEHGATCAIAVDCS